MKEINDDRVVLIGGSAGSFPVVLEILEQIPKGYPIPIVICMHRLKQVLSGFVETISMISKNLVIEPFDYDILEAGKVYVAPANYHVMISENRNFILSTEEVINYSRPSIDVLFSYTARALHKNVIGIILSGANRDGAIGLQQIKEYGGVTIVQDLKEAQVTEMPQAAILKCKPDYIIKANSIVAYLNSLV